MFESRELKQLALCCFWVLGFRGFYGVYGSLGFRFRALGFYGRLGFTGVLGPFSVYGLRW